MRIPVGRTYTSTIIASQWKKVICDNCNRSYFYKLTRSVSGSSTDLLWLRGDNAKFDAYDKAKNRANLALQYASDTYYCPHCGHYPKPYALKKYKSEKSEKTIWLVILIALGVLCLFGIYHYSNNVSDLTYLFVAAIFLIIDIIGIFIVVFNSVKNINDDSRTRLQQKYSNDYPVIADNDFESIEKYIKK